MSSLVLAASATWRVPITSPFGVEDVDVDGAGRELLGQGLAVDALVLGLLLLRGVAGVAVVLVDGEDGDEGGVEAVDDGGAGERTRSHGGGPASAAAEVDAAVHGEQEDRPVVLGGEPAGGAEVGRPADRCRTASRRRSATTRSRRSSTVARTWSSAIGPAASRVGANRSPAARDGRNGRGRIGKTPAGAYVVEANRPAGRGQTRSRRKSSGHWPTAWRRRPATRSPLAADPADRKRRPIFQSAIGQSAQAGFCRSRLQNPSRV